MRLWSGVVLALLFSMAGTSRASEDKPPSEASMLVNGTITLNGDGSVRSYHIDHADRLSEVVMYVIAHRLPEWKFQPPEGRPDGVTGRMTLRMLSRPIDDKRDRVSIGGASFYDEPADSGWEVTAKTRGSPAYPMTAMRVREGGTVYLLLRIGRDGRVQDVFTEQVNLEAYASKQLMSELREGFANSAVRAARQWTFNVPTKGKKVDAPYWYVRTPVIYYLRVARDTPPPGQDGRWQAYVPGPRSEAPWATYHKPDRQYSDAMANASLQEEGGNLRLLSSLDGE